MEMALSICKKEFRDEQRTRKRKRKKVDWFMFLQDDILLNILKRLPKIFLGYRAKYVCRRWWDLITNRLLLDRASFIIQETLKTRQIGIRKEKEGLQVKVQDLDIPFIGTIESWGNEFLLISNFKEQKRYLYVYNLVTNEGSYLPECNTSCRGYCPTKCGVAISFDWFKGIYKVVHLSSGPPIECRVLILRKNIASSKWKKIQVACMNGGWLFSGKPVSVQGRYIYWKVNWDVKCDKRLVSIDMVKEEIFDRSLSSSITLTGDGLWGYDIHTIFEMGGSLALFAGFFNKAEIWILKDFQKNKWEKLQSVNLKDYEYYKRFHVCGVMSNKYMILEYKFYNGMRYHHLKNGVKKKVDIKIGFGNRCVVHSSPPSFK